MEKPKRGPKYLSDYIKDINRKVLYKEPFIIHEFEISPIKEKTIGGSDEELDVTEIISNTNTRLRLFNSIYKQFNSAGIAACVIRKLIETEQIPKIERWKLPIRSCLAINDLHLDKLLPRDFKPKYILLISPDELPNPLPDVELKYISNFKCLDDTSETFDLIILANILHHDRHIDIAKFLNPGGYLFIREIDSSDESSDVFDLLHALVSDHIRKHIYVSKKDCMKIFEKFKFVSETIDKGNLYCMLFTI